MHENYALLLPSTTKIFYNENFQVYDNIASSVPTTIILIIPSHLYDNVLRDAEMDIPRHNVLGKMLRDPKVSQIL